MGISKYQAIADDLKKKIVQGEYALDAAIPSELQLQKDYAVSRHTVRQAIALLVNEGYLRAEKGSGTYVDNAYLVLAAALPIKENKTIGVIITYLSDYIFPSIIRGLEKTLRQQGYSLLLASTNNDHRQERECLEKMLDYGVQGLIIEPTKSNQYNPNIALYVKLREQKIPMVMINAAYEELALPSLCVDDTQAGFLATELLIKEGHQQLLFIAKIDDLQGKYRLKGFIQACETYDVLFASEDIITYTTETRKEIYQQVLTRLNQKAVTGIICYNDQIASRLLDVLEEHHFQVPQAISLVGNDNASVSKVGKVKLTTLEHPKEKMGVDAANWLIQAIETQQEPPSILYEPKLIKRDSTRKIK